MSKQISLIQLLKESSQELKLNEIFDFDNIAEYDFKKINNFKYEFKFNIDAKEHYVSVYFEDITEDIIVEYKTTTLFKQTYAAAKTKSIIFNSGYFVDGIESKALNISIKILFQY